MADSAEDTASSNKNRQEKQDIYAWNHSSINFCVGANQGIREQRHRPKPKLDDLCEAILTREIQDKLASGVSTLKSYDGGGAKTDDLTREAEKMQLDTTTSPSVNYNKQINSDRNSKSSARYIASEPQHERLNNTGNTFSGTYDLVPPKLNFILPHYYPQQFVLVGSEADVPWHQQASNATTATTQPSTFQNRTMQYEVYDANNNEVKTKEKGIPASLQGHTSSSFGLECAATTHGVFGTTTEETEAHGTAQSKIPHIPAVVQTGLGPAVLIRRKVASSDLDLAHPDTPIPIPMEQPTVPNDPISSPTKHDVSTVSMSEAPPTIKNPSSTMCTSTRFQRWTEEQDTTLLLATKEQGGPPYNWNRIASKYFQNARTGPQCKARWKKALKPGLKRGKWDAEEDRIILELRSKGEHWTEIANHVPGRSPDHIHQRYMNALDPNRKKTPWTKEENTILYDAQKRMGNKWTEISKLLPGRSENDIKNRWHNAKMSQRRKMRRVAKESARIATFEKQIMDDEIVSHSSETMCDSSTDVSFHEEK